MRPHVIGVLLDTLRWAEEWLRIEVNSANGNPLFDAGSGEVFSGGNFYGGHCTHAMDALKTAMANIADLLDRQLALVVDERFSNGLPSNLAPSASEGQAERGLHHGFKGIQIACSAVAAEALKATMPASVFSRSTEGHNQDKVSMSAIAGRDARFVAELVEEVLAMHLLACCQGVELRGVDRCSTATLRVVESVRSRSAFVDRDRVLEPEVRSMLEAIRTGDFAEAYPEECF